MKRLFIIIFLLNTLLLGLCNGDNIEREINGKQIELILIAFKNYIKDIEEKIFNDKIYFFYMAIIRI